jgi:hypothetical protein
MGGAGFTVAGGGAAAGRVRANPDEGDKCLVQKNFFE